MRRQAHTDGKRRQHTQVHRHIQGNSRQIPSLGLHQTTPHAHRKRPNFTVHQRPQKTIKPRRIHVEDKADVEPAEVKNLLEKERLEKHALNRIRWDTRLKGEDFTVSYLDRVTKKQIEAPYNQITIDGDYFHHNVNQIPMHRIRKIKYKGEGVWDKRKTKD